MLKTKRKSAHLFDVIFERVRGMLSVRPIVGNIIAIGLVIFALFYIQNEIAGTAIEKYQLYLTRGMCIFAGLQIIKSATRSLLLPIITLIVGNSIAHSLGPNELLMGFDATFYQRSEQPYLR